MGRNRFVTLETVRLDLSDDDWIEVKKQLSYREEQQLAGAGLSKVAVSTINPDAEEVEVGMDMAAHNICRLSLWIVDWSFCGENDKRIGISADAIGMLAPSTVREIDRALTAHIEAGETEKNAPRRKRAAATKSAS